MLITIGLDQKVNLEQSDNFKEFKILANGSPNDFTAVDSALRNVSAGESDGSHGWISQSWLRAQVSDPAWRQSLGTLLAFAQSKGWINDQGAVRAHIEWV